MPRLKVGRLTTPVETHAVPLAVDADAVAVQLCAQQLGYPLRRRRGLKGQDAAAVVVEDERDVAPRHGQALHSVETCRIFRTRTAQKFPSCRYLVEQPFDPDASSGRQGSGPLTHRRPMIDLGPPAVRASNPAFQREPRNAGDRGQRFSTKAEARDAIENLIRQLRRRMPLQCEAHFVGRHAATVVGDFDQFEPARREPDSDRLRTGIKGIFDKLLEGARGAFYDLASGDAIHKLGRQPSY